MRQGHIELETIKPFWSMVAQNLAFRKVHAEKTIEAVSRT
jgi:hypothetical protein